MYEAKKLFVKSEWMRDEVVRVYKVPVEKIGVIPKESATWIKEILETYRNVTEGEGSK